MDRMTRNVIIVAAFLAPAVIWGVITFLIGLDQPTIAILCIASGIVGGVFAGLIAIEYVATNTLSSFNRWMFIVWGAVFPTFLTLCMTASGDSSIPEQPTEASHERIVTTPQQGLNLRGQWEPWSPGWTQTPGPSGYGIGFTLPPQTRHTLCTFTDVYSEAYLVCGEDEPVPLPLAQLRDRAKSEGDDEVWFEIFRLDPSNGRFSHHFWNNRDTVSILYLQTATPSTVQVTYNLPRCKQWLIHLDGPDNAQFTIPENWKYLWVIPLRSEEHLPIFAGNRLTPEGISRVELEAMLSEEVAGALLAGSEPGIAYRGLYWSVDDGPASPLLHPLTWQHGELAAGTEITLGINIARDDQGRLVEVPDRPAGVLIGIKE